MIAVAEIRERGIEWQLREDVVEKDYVLGLLLAAIATDDELKDTWIFKGGTALRKCFFETYRFSEDLDFTERLLQTLARWRNALVHAPDGYGGRAAVSFQPAVTPMGY